MNSTRNQKNKPSEVPQKNGVGQDVLKNHEIAEPFTTLEQGVYAALETYSNVHRGSGHNSMVSTHLFVKAREIVLEYLGINNGKYTVIFCTPFRAAGMKSKLEAKNYKSLSSEEFGLSIGVCAMAVLTKALPEGTPFQVGGGTARLVSKDWVIWAAAPEKFEAGTPAIINVIAFARALQMIKSSGKEIFLNPVCKKQTAAEILYHDELEKYDGNELLDELRKTVIGRGALVPTMEGEKPFINLDNSASTPTFTPIWNAFHHTLYQHEQVKLEIIREVKSICAGIMGAPSSVYDVIFTSNTTEAINITAQSFSRESSSETEPVIVNTILEHNSNDLPWRRIPGCSLIRLSVDDEGYIDLKELETLLADYNQKVLYGRKRISLVAVSGASNVLGVCNNLEEISRIVHRYEARLLVDAAQLVAHRKVNMEGCGIDYLVFSAHKVYAPFGCGVLVYRKGLLNFKPDETEKIQSSGEENAAGIAALGKALVLLQRIGMDIIIKEEQALTRHVLLRMAEIPGLKVYGIKNPDSPEFDNKIGVIVFALNKMISITLARELSLRGGIGIRSGCHCAHIIIKHVLNVSPFLEGFQRVIQTLFPKLKFPGLARLSLGIENSKEDVDTFIRVLGEIAGKEGTHPDRNSEPGQKARPGLTRAVVEKHLNDYIVTAAKRVYIDNL